TAIGGSLAAISGMLMDVKPDRLYAPQTSSVPGSDGFMHPAFSAVPTIRIADEEAMSRKIHEVAEMVGIERFYLTVGGLLHKKSAMVGLKPDGVVVRSDAERIQAGRILEEKVREAESHKRTVINPSIAEFTAMMGQIDELQQVRARIRLEQMAANASKEEIEQSDRETMEFFAQPDVKEKYEKLKQTRQKQRRATEKMRQLEAEDPTLPMRLAGMQEKKEDAPATATASTTSSASTAKSTSKTAAKIPVALPKAASSKKPITTKASAKTSSVVLTKAVPSSMPKPSEHAISSSDAAEMNRAFNYSRTRDEQSSAAREAFSMATSIREKAEVFAREHPTFAKWGGYALKGVGATAVVGALVTAAEAGAAAFLTAGASMLATDQAMAAIIENGTEAFVEYAASQGKTVVEARKFADTAVWAVEMIITGAAAVGFTKLIKNGGAIMTKLGAIKSATGTLATRVFSRTQTSAAKIDTTSLQRVVASAETGPYVMMETDRLNWNAVRESHVRKHGGQNLSKLEHGVFYGDPVRVTNEAWEIAQNLKIEPIKIDINKLPNRYSSTECYRNHYVVPRSNSGYYGGYGGNGENLNFVLIVTEAETNRIITSFPSHAVSGDVKTFLIQEIYGAHKK
ncbi:MAG: hypothetical protein LBP41_00140, partial [Holosporaceae bacterium]|nr:hypothetical protein [Holosporaceae bacterium]